MRQPGERLRQRLRRDGAAAREVELCEARQQRCGLSDLRALQPAAVRQLERGHVRRRLGKAHDAAGLEAVGAVQGEAAEAGVRPGARDCGRRLVAKAAAAEAQVQRLDPAATRSQSAQD